MATNNERDTRFLGFANLSIDKLEQKRLIPIHPKSLRNDMATIIAQCAYDLIEHTLDSIRPDVYWGSFGPEKTAKDIPDLT